MNYTLKAALMAVQILLLRWIPRTDLESHGIWSHPHYLVTAEAALESHCSPRSGK